VAPIATVIRGPSRFAVSDIPVPRLACLDMHVFTEWAPRDAFINPSALSNGTEPSPRLAYRGAPLQLDGLIVAAEDDYYFGGALQLARTIYRIAGLRHLTQRDAKLFFSPKGYTNRPDVPGLLW
jgi:hypothetical protein